MLKIIGLKIDNMGKYNHNHKVDKGVIE